MEASRSLLVIGAGIVGLACAVEAQRRGRRVTLIDCADPGHGCSLGNAGILAVSEIFPLITPARLAMLPQMLLSRNAPAVIQIASLPRLMPWMLRAATSLGSNRQQEIVSALTALNMNTLPAWRSLLAHCDASQLLRENGMIRLIRDERSRTALKQTHHALAAHSLQSRMLSRDDVLELEPRVGREVIGGLLHESDADIGDPLLSTRALARRLNEAGGKILRDEALGLTPTETGIAVQCRSGTFHADQAMVTMGLDSKKLLAPLGFAIPIQAERGYHLMLPGAGSFLNRPVTFQHESCVATPMGSDLRLAGTVEFAGAESMPDWSRAERLATHAAHYFDDKLAATEGTKWIGSRPSLPDSLPAIGRLTGIPRVGYAFGHQHLGVTQAAISAVLLNQLLDGVQTTIDCSPFTIDRFARG